MNKLGIDKYYHFVGGYMINDALGHWLVVMDVTRLLRMPVLIVAPVLAGVLKEVYDVTVKRQCAEWLDVVATALGGWAIGISLIFM